MSPGNKYIHNSLLCGRSFEAKMKEHNDNTYSTASALCCRFSGLALTTCRLRSLYMVCIKEIVYVLTRFDNVTQYKKTILYICTLSGGGCGGAC